MSKQHDRRRYPSCTPLVALLLLVLALAPGCGGGNSPDTEAAADADATGDDAGNKTITELSALTLSPGATLHEGSEVSLAGVRVETLVGDSAFVVAEYAGGNIDAQPAGGYQEGAEADVAGDQQQGQGATEQQGDAPASDSVQAPGGPVGDNANSRLLVIVTGMRPSGGAGLSPQVEAASPPDEAATQGSPAADTAGTPDDVSTPGETTAMPDQGDIVSIHGWVDVGDAEELQERHNLNTEQLGYEGEIVYVLADQIIHPAER